MILFRQQVEEEIAYLKASGGWDAHAEEFWNGYLGVSKRAESIYNAAMSVTIKIITRSMLEAGSDEAAANRAVYGAGIPYDAEAIYRDLVNALLKDDYRKLALVSELPEMDDPEMEE